MFRLADGIWAMFAFFQDARDAKSVGIPWLLGLLEADIWQSFKDHPIYRLEHPPLPEEIQARNKRVFQTPHSKSSPSHGYMSPSVLSRRSTDRCSIFIGNLPAKVTQEQLVKVFGPCGRVRSIEIVAKPSVNGKILSHDLVPRIAYLNFCSERCQCVRLHGVCNRSRSPRSP